MRDKDKCLIKSYDILKIMTTLTNRQFFHTIENPLEILCYRDYPEGDSNVSQKKKKKAQKSKGKGPIFYCKACQTPITTRREAIDIEDKHEHTFFNPSGILFEIGCFGEAPGCRVSGITTSEFAWFRGFLWQYASCLSCNIHLGWYFTPSSRSGSGFFGLIMNRLVEEESTERK